jgi:hypothetical protein
VKSLLLSAIFISTIVQAKTIQVKINEIQLLVSKNCKTSKCDAIKELKKMDLKVAQEMEQNLLGGKTLGEEICRKLFKVEIERHRDNQKNEQNYCHFKDKSFISTAEINKFIYDQIYPDRH